MGGEAASENLLGFFVDGLGTEWVARVTLVVASMRINQSGGQAAASAQDASSVATKLQRRSSAF